MKHFINTLNNKYRFSTCEGCESNCCDGRNGTTFSQIILDDFIQIYENYPILFIFGELGYIKPVLILTNGKDYCRYLKDSKCTIYDKRSSICKAYPLSANLDNNIYVDHLCPAVNKEGTPSTILVENQKINKNFYSDIFDNYQDKYIKTHEELEKFNIKTNFEVAITINGIDFYKYNKQTNNKYLKLHQNSLKLLEDDYFKCLNS
ncbi:MAG: YkgJ family cysteine cluster protein [Campylobacterota bacterium]